MSASADISVNRKALRDFHILERLEAGVELKGTEVKSIRSGLANLNNAFARIEDGQVFFYDVDIQPTPVPASSSMSLSGAGACCCIVRRSTGSSGSRRSKVIPLWPSDVLEGCSGQNRARCGER